MRKSRLPGSNSRPNVSEGYEVPTELPGSTGWMYQPGSHRRKVTEFFVHLASVVHAFTFLARRIQPFLSLVDREVEFCVLMI